MSRTGRSRLRGHAASLFQDLERRIDRALAELPSPGLNVALLIDDEVVWTYASGVARFDPHEELTPDHLHRIGSITKVFTAHAILLLRDAGKLDLDDPVGRYVPEFSGERADRVTIRHMLCHGSGISGEGGRNAWGSGVFPDEAEFRRWIAGFAPVAPPMKHLKYSNAAYSMLGLVIAKASGMPYERFLVEALLEPLGMKEAAFYPHGDLADRLADGHVLPPYERRFEKAPYHDLKAFNACGMLAATARDALKLAGLQWNTGSLLSEESRDEMHRVHLMSTDLPGWQSAYGLGWRLTRVGQRIFAGHGGGYVGNRCQIDLSLPDRVAIALYANCGQAMTTAPLAQALLGDVIDACEPPQTEGLDAGPVPEAWAYLLGTYGLRHWFKMSIEYERGRLWLVSEMERHPLAAREHGRFEILGGRYVGEELAELGRDEQGRCSEISMAGLRMARL